MKIQEQVFERTAELRTRAAALVDAAVKIARARAGLTTQRVDALKSSLAQLSVAGRALEKVARRHAVRFVRENSALATDAGKDVRALARETLSTFTRRTPKTARKPAARKMRKPAARKAASKAA